MDNVLLMISVPCAKGSLVTDRYHFGHCPKKTGIGKTCEGGLGMKRCKLSKRIAVLEAENTALATRLNESKKYFTVMRVAKINRMARILLCGLRLKNISDYLQLEVRKAFDPNLGDVDAYHIDAWLHEYPELVYEEKRHGLPCEYEGMCVHCGHGC